MKKICLLVASAFILTLLTSHLYARGKMSDKKENLYELEKIAKPTVSVFGKLDKPLIVESKFFSKSAIKKLESAGGKAVIIGKSG